jgi:A/G-specific adenine glycosylase
VIRVLSRLRAIGLNPKSKEGIAKFWKLAGDVLDKDRPGHFNQALMDLGATVCTPLNPTCNACPISSHCLALKQQKSAKELIKSRFFSKKKVKSTPDFECSQCIPYVDLEDVTTLLYPLKVAKKDSKLQEVAVAVIEIASSSRFLTVQGPETGLLAKLYDFPTSVIDTKAEASSAITGLLENDYGLKIEGNDVRREFVGTITHIFSHIKRTMHVEHIVLSEEPQLTTDSKIEWALEDDIVSKKLGTPTTARKVLKLLKDHSDGNPKKKRIKTESAKENDAVVID